MVLNALAVNQPPCRKVPIPQQKWALVSSRKYLADVNVVAMRLRMIGDYTGRRMAPDISKLAEGLVAKVDEALRANERMPQQVGQSISSHCSLCEVACRSSAHCRRNPAGGNHAS